MYFLSSEQTENHTSILTMNTKRQKKKKNDEIVVIIFRYSLKMLVS
jgi:hypothetical protein